MSKKHVTIPLFIPHHGCPHRCAFCNQHLTTGTGQLPRRKDVIEKIEQYLGKIKTSVERIEAAFFGGSFTGITPEYQKELLGAAYGYLQKNIIQGIRVSTRPDFIDEDRLSLLKKYGVTTIELGIQSFHDNVLMASQRGHTARDSMRALELVKRMGFQFIIQLMPGLPGDSREISLQSALTARGYSPGGVRIYPAVVLKNTGLYTLYEMGLYTPLSLEEAIELCRDITVIMEESHIPVIRTGLHPMADDETANIAAGPYHPSFGFFVKSRLKRDVMEKKIKDFIAINGHGVDRKLVMSIPRKSVEEYIGHRTGNILYLKNNYSLKGLAYEVCDCDEVHVDNARI